MTLTFICDQTWHLFMVLIIRNNSIEILISVPMSSMVTILYKDFEMQGNDTQISWPLISEFKTW